MITRALVGLGATGRTGVGLVAIRHWIEARYPVPDNSSRYIRSAVRTGINSGHFAMHTNSVRLTAKGVASGVRGLKKKKKNTIKKATTTTIKKKVVKSKKATVKEAVPIKLSKAASNSFSGMNAAIFSKDKPAQPKAPKAGGVQPKGKAGASKQAHIWQYEDGGRYHDYDAAASDVVEQCYQEYLANPNMMDVRAVKSGDWQYQVDFINNKQTNIQHQNHKVRNIRRIPNPYL